MDLFKIETWDETIWRSMEPIYNGAFPGPHKKTRAIFQRALSNKVGTLYGVAVDDKIVAMAFVGVSQRAKALIIDYIAVASELRSQGIGTKLLIYLMESARSMRLRGVMIEVEHHDNGDEEQLNESNKRIQFWQNHGFHLTEYVHTYRIISEQYRAMYKNLDNSDPLPNDGIELFQYISEFHKLTHESREVSNL